MTPRTMANKYRDLEDGLLPTSSPHLSSHDYSHSSSSSNNTNGGSTNPENAGSSSPNIFSDWQDLCPASTFSIPGLITMFVIVTTISLLVYYASNLFQLLEVIKDLGPLGVIIFAVCYIPSALPFALISVYVPLSISAAYMYGYLLGMLTITIGGAMGACVGFWITRRFARSWIEERVRRSEKLSSVMDAMGQHNFKIAIAVRFLPVPFGLQNALCAITTISMQDFIIASVLGMLPENMLLAYFGGSVRNAAELTNGTASGSGSIFQKILLLVALALAIIIFVVGRRLALQSRNNGATKYARSPLPKPIKRRRRSKSHKSQHTLLSQNEAVPNDGVESSDDSNSDPETNDTELGILDRVSFGPPGQPYNSSPKLESNKSTSLS